MTDHAVIGYLRRDLVHGAFSESLLSVVMEGKTPVDTVLALEWGPNLSTGRNLIVRDFLDRPGSPPWLLMVDTDMVLQADTADRLIAAADPAERPIVGALCYSLSQGVKQPTMYELVEGAPGGLAFRRLREWPEDACVRVSATGTGCLLMHRDALLAVEKRTDDPCAPWFRESAIGAPLSLMGEDLTFCLRAGAAGIPIHVATGVRVGHMKTTMLI